MWLPRRGASHEPITTRVTFNKEIVRIFRRHCLACHDSRSITNIPLATFAQARPWAKAFKEEVLERRMPPAQAVKGFGSFQNDYSLTQQELDQIVSWVEGGTPKGDDKELPAAGAPEEAWALGDPNLVVQPQQTANIPAGEGDDVRCFELPTGLKDDRWLSAIDFRPGSRDVVLRASFGVAPSIVHGKAGSGDQCGENSPGFERLGTWMPGQAPTRLPSGIAQRLPANVHLLLQIRYRKTTSAAADRSSLGLYLSPELAAKPVRKIKLSPQPLDISTAPKAYRVRASFTLRKTAQAIAIRPLPGPLVRSLEVAAHRPDGSTEVLVLTKDYRDDWQRDFVFKSPVWLPQGTRIEATAYRDNPTPAKATRFDSPLCELSLAEVGNRRLSNEPVAMAHELTGAMIADLFVCPMHPDITADKAGQCPKCGMTLVRTGQAALDDYDLKVTATPTLVQPGQSFSLSFVVASPRNTPTVSEFNIIHERPFHLFLVSADLNYFAHLHPEQQRNGGFIVRTAVPRAGVYFAYCDFFPVGGLPQLLRRSLFTAGFTDDLFAARAQLEPDAVLTRTVAGIRSALTLNPVEPVAGKQASLIYHLSDANTGRQIMDLQPYLGAWVHTMIVSEDGSDFVHAHSAQVLRKDLNGKFESSDLTVDLFFPRPGHYRIWSQFQRQGKVITVQNTVNVRRF